MNAFTNPINPKPDMLTMVHGRKGQPTEFVEYSPFNSQVKFAAQKCGDFYNVFEIHPGKKGRVVTLDGSANPELAALIAHDAALAHCYKNG